MRMYVQIVDAPEVMTGSELARLLNVSAAMPTLWHQRGKGPRSVMSADGRRRLYRLADVSDWIANGGRFVGRGERGGIVRKASRLCRTIAEAA